MAKFAMLAVQSVAVSYELHDPDACEQWKKAVS